MKAVPGKPLITGPIGSATFQNNLVDMVDWWKRTVRGNPQRALPVAIQTDVIKVKNVSGADRGAGQVLEIGTLVLTTLDRRNIWFNADTISHSVGRSYCVLPRPIPSGEIDDAHISGVCVAKVNIIATTDRYAFVEASSNVLKSGKTGQFKLLGPVTATGEQSVAVCFADDGRPVRLCKPVSNISKGASGSITLYDGETASQTVTAKAIMAAVTGGGSAKWCTAFWDGTWFVLPGEC
jgi:hypothetical protein